MKIVVIADIHLGVLDPDDQWKNLQDTFIAHCKKSKPDIIVVAGDIMDEKVSVNSITASVFHMFIDELKSLNSTVLIIEGTKSHDDNQINIFSHSVNENFKIYNKVTIDYIKDLKILFIPEEYMHNPEEYYKEYLNGNEYDFVFGHGEFAHLAFNKRRTRSKFRKLTAPIWDYNKNFSKIVLGNIAFGHYHTYSKYKKFLSIGSFGRYRHGEEEKKGFLEINYDDKKHKTISIKRIINKNALKFITIKESKLPDDNDKLMKYLKSKCDESYRFRISLDREYSPTRLSNLISFVKSNVTKASIDNRIDRLRRKKEIIETHDGNTIIENKYENMNMLDATVEWVSENKNIKFKRSDISQILNDGEV